MIFQTYRPSHRYYITPATDRTGWYAYRTTPEGFESAGLLIGQGDAWDVHATLAWLGTNKNP